MLPWLPRILAAFVVLATALPLVRRDAWWIRAWEFPRVQILALAALTLALAPWLEPSGRKLAAILGGVGAAAVLQAVRVLPFTPLWRRRESLRATEAGGTFSLLVANVLMTNRDHERFHEVVGALEPDVLLVIEPNAWWSRALEPLRRSYPHRVERPQEDTYGMILLSRLPLRDPELRYLVRADVPSIRCTLDVPGAGPLVLYGLHPRPPAPGEAIRTTRRDAELLLVAREIRAAPGAAVVAGDLNDVAWSYTTRLFRRVSGQLDPRIGRGLFATFPAARPWLRFPLDHVFHSAEIELVELRLTAAFGSDHLGVFARLRLVGDPSRQEEPTADREDLELAREKIAAGRSSPGSAR